VGPGSFRRLAVAAAVPLAAGCSFDAGDWRDTAYRCGPEMSCPDGTHCSDGVCITGDGASAIDGGGVDAAAAACADNLVMNPSFETGTSGWGGVGGPITQINEGHDGEHAAQKCYDGSDTYYNVSDQPDSVTQTSVGAVYSTSAWLRSAAGQTLRAVIRVKNAAGEPLEQTSTPIILKADWQEVTAQHTVDLLLRGGSGRGRRVLRHRRHLLAPTPRPRPACRPRRQPLSSTAPPVP